MKNLKEKQVLVAEDDKPVAKALMRKLEKAGIKAELVSNGEDALEAISKKSFDLILLDVMMPKKDGFSVLKEAKENGIKTPIVVTSNLGQKEDKEKAISLGAKDYFVKSDTPVSEIVEYIKTSLEA
jgi:DNA-binding response OmpR family regulator